VSERTKLLDIDNEYNNKYLSFYFFYNYKSILKVLMFVFVGCLCGRKPKNLYETHLSTLISTCICLWYRC